MPSGMPGAQPVVDHGGDDSARSPARTSFSIIEAMISTSYGVRFF